MLSWVGYSHLRPMTRKWCIWHSRRGWILVSRRLRLCLWCHARDWLATNRGSQSCNLCFGRSLARGGGRLCLGSDLTKKKKDRKDLKRWNSRGNPSQTLVPFNFVCSCPWLWGGDSLTALTGNSYGSPPAYDCLSDHGFASDSILFFVEKLDFL